MQQEAPHELLSNKQAACRSMGHKLQCNSLAQNLIFCGINMETRHHADAYVEQESCAAKDQIGICHPTKLKHKYLLN